MPRLLAASAVCLLTLTVASAADWPQWGGPNRDGVSTETGLLKDWPKGGPKLAWKEDIKGAGYGSPAVVGDKLFIAAAEDAKGGQKEFVVCLSTKDGKQIWRQALPNGTGGYNTGYGSGPRSTPTVDGDLLYILGPRGDLSCLKTSDGNKVWSVNFKDDFGGHTHGWGFCESVLIDGNKLVCSPGGSKGSMVALDKKTGKTIWRTTELKDDASSSSIIAADIGQTRQYITQTQSAAVGVNADNGKLLWRVAELRRSTAVNPSPVVVGNLAFFTSGYGAGCELIKIDTSENGMVKASPEYTKNPAIANHHGGVVRIGDYIYGHTDRGGKWFCYDFKKGGEEFVWESKGQEKGSVIAADGMLYTYGEGKGTCILVEASPEGWKEHGRLDLPEKSKYPRGSGRIWTHPVVANGKLYLRDHEMLFCFDIAAK